MQGRFLVSIATLFWLSSAAAQAPADNVDVNATVQAPSATGSTADGALHAFLEQRDAEGRRCDLKATVALGGLRYFACGDAGLWIARIMAHGSLAAIERRTLDGAATNLFVRDGYLWVEFASVHASRIAPSDVTSAATASASAPAPAAAVSATQEAVTAPAAPTEPAAPEAPRAQPVASYAPPSIGKVVASAHGVVTIDRGRKNAVDDGDHVAFYAYSTEDLGGNQHAVLRHKLAVGRVISVADERAQVVLGLDERVALGSVAILTNAPLTAASLAPPRPGGLWELAFVARPFMVLENLGGGVFLDGRAGFRTQNGWHFEALLQPFALASAREGAAVPFAAAVTGSYDAQLFEVGLGVGGQSLNEPAFDLEPGTGITLAQRLRLGARDGLMLEAFSYVVLFHSEFKLSSVRLEGQIPLTDSAWLLLAGGGGVLGLGYGEIGLRLLLVGNGDRGSFFLRTVIGGVEVFKQRPCLSPPIGGSGTCPQNIDYGGPMIGAGGEWRL